MVQEGIVQEGCRVQERCMVHEEGTVQEGCT